MTNKQLKILVITKSDEFKNRMDLNHRDLIDQLSKDTRFTVMDSSSVNKDIMEDYDIIFNDVWPDVKCEKKINCKFFEDYYHLNLQNTKVSGYDFLLLRYKTPKTISNEIFDIPLENKHFIPHHFDLNVWKNWKLPKIYDIIIYGFMRESLYPFRARLKSILLKSNFKIKFIDHPGYDNVNCIRREELSKLINQSWLCLSVPMNNTKDWDDFLKKFGEGSLSYSMVLGSIPKEAESYYKDNFCKILPEMSDDEIISEITKTLTNKDKMIEQIDEVYNTFKKEFNIDSYSEKIYNFCSHSYESLNK
jgi:hypothetical protein